MGKLFKKDKSYSYNEVIKKITENMVEDSNDIIDLVEINGLTYFLTEYDTFVFKKNENGNFVIIN